MFLEISCTHKQVSYACWSQQQERKGIRRLIGDGWESNRNRQTYV